VRLQDGPKAAGWSEKDSALLQVADDLFENSVVSDETWEILARHYSTEQLMDAVFTVGQYNLVSWALNSFGVPLDDFPAGREALESFDRRGFVPSSPFKWGGAPVIRGGGVMGNLTGAPLRRQPRPDPIG
jgi:hypothetical protein